MSAGTLDSLRITRQSTSNHTTACFIKWLKKNSLVSFGSYYHLLIHLQQHSLLLTSAMPQSFLTSKSHCDEAENALMIYRPPGDRTAERICNVEALNTPRLSKYFNTSHEFSYQVERDADESFNYDSLESHIFMMHGSLQRTATSESVAPLSHKLLLLLMLHFMQMSCSNVSKEPDFFRLYNWVNLGF